MSRFELGFKSVELPVILKDCSYANDACLSFYFEVNGQYYQLWVNHKDKAQREDAEAARYSVCKAINEGDDDSPEIHTDHEFSDLFQAEEVGPLIRFIQTIQ